MKLKTKFLYFNKYLLFFESSLAAILSLIVLATIFWQVLCRYIFYISTPWAEELARYMFICLVYIGAGVGVYYAQFVSVDLMDKVLEKVSKDPKRAKLNLDKLQYLLTLVFLVVFLALYTQYYSKIASLGQLSAAMKMNMLIPMGSLLIGCVCMIFHAIARLVSSKEERDAVDAEFEARSAARKAKGKRKLEVRGVGNDGL
jgi:TRAP-type C4-dicarboxylate transport system permease small subunit